MQINVNGRHIEVTSALNDYVTSKMQRLERHFDNITTMQVTLTVEKQRQIADASLHIAGAELFAEAESADMYASIDALIDKLDKQILKHKGKQEARRQVNV
jgi:putative sigma-54 modulation protein